MMTVKQGRVTAAVGRRAAHGRALWQEPTTLGLRVPRFTERASSGRGGSTPDSPQCRKNHAGFGTEQAQSCSFAWFSLSRVLFQVETLPVDQPCLLLCSSAVSALSSSLTGHTGSSDISSSRRHCRNCLRRAHGLICQAQCLKCSLVHSLSGKQIEKSFSQCPAMFIFQVGWPAVTLVSPEPLNLMISSCCLPA